MKNEHFSFILIEQNKNNAYEESDFSDEKEIKNKGFDLKKYEKFKPKISKKQIKNQ